MDEPVIIRPCEEAIFAGCLRRRDQLVWGRGGNCGCFIYGSSEHVI